MNRNIDMKEYKRLEELIERAFDSIEVEYDGSIIKPCVTDLLDDILNQLSIGVKDE